MRKKPTKTEQNYQEVPPSDMFIKSLNQDIFPNSDVFSLHQNEEFALSETL